MTRVLSGVARAATRPRKTPAPRLAQSHAHAPIGIQNDTVIAFDDTTVSETPDEMLRHSPLRAVHRLVEDALQLVNVRADPEAFLTVCEALLATAVALRS
jgi:hypothetical protein